VHGAVRGAIEHIESVLSKEFNSVTDNPLLFADDGDVISGGNFHGEPIALCCDYLAIAVSELGSISERRLERMVNPQLSNGLPPFLAEQPGLNSGMMILQYTSASLVSDNKTLSHPDSVDSIPSSANQEDHVSMGTNAARHVSMVVDNTYNILAYEMFAAAQAVDLRGASISPALNNIMDLIREHIPFLNEDSELRLYICKIQKLLRGEMIIDTALQNCPLLK
jgi:histidine ammonia-lyase